MRSRQGIVPGRNGATARTVSRPRRRDKHCECHYEEQWRDQVLYMGRSATSLDIHDLESIWLQVSRHFLLDASALANFFGLTPIFYFEEKIVAQRPSRDRGTIPNEAQRLGGWIPVLPRRYTWHLPLPAVAGPARTRRARSRHRGKGKSHRHLTSSAIPPLGEHASLTTSSGVRGSRRIASGGFRRLLKSGTPHPAPGLSGLRGSGVAIRDAIPIGHSRARQCPLQGGTSRARPHRHNPRCPALPLVAARRRGGAATTRHSGCLRPRPHGIRGPADASPALLVTYL